MEEPVLVFKIIKILGFWAGANIDGQTYQPDITSYDYDAAINEAGQVTERYTALREAIAKFVLWDIPAIPAALPMIEIPAFTPKKLSNIISNAKEGPVTLNPLAYEALDQPFGVVIYTTTLPAIAAGIDL